jgi:Mother cell inhibitor of FtsZ
MKMYVLEKGIIFSGKAWEIKQKLKEMQHQHTYVNDWITDIHQQDLTTRRKSV